MEHLRGILFIDIETVPVAKSYDLLSEGLKNEWIRKAKNIKYDQNLTDPEHIYSERSGVFSEFAKVVCIGIGSLVTVKDGWQLRLKSFTGDDERLLLCNFGEVIERFARAHPNPRFCGHNIKEFDIPFLSRRMVINGLGLPSMMDHQGKKPWEVPHHDTMDMWRFGDYKNYTPLSLLATVLGIPSPKDDIDGSMVGSVYWNDHDLGRISKYCLQDVATTAKVYIKLSGLHNFECSTHITTD